MNYIVTIVVSNATNAEEVKEEFLDLDLESGVIDDVRVEEMHDN